MANPKKNKNEATKPKATKPKVDELNKVEQVANNPNHVVIIGTEKGTLRTGRKYKVTPKLALLFINKGFATLEE